VHACPKCQSDRVINNGSAAGKPKKQCKQCGYQFTRTTPRGKPLVMKVNAVLWYLSGMSMNRIAFLLRVSAQAVLTWIRDWATDSYTLDAYSLPYTIRVAKAKSGRPKSRLSRMPRLYAAPFAETRISRPQVLWAPGYLSPKLSLKFEKVVSTT
jgi:transposase-like protein